MKWNDKREKCVRAAATFHISWVSLHTGTHTPHRTASHRRHTPSHMRETAEHVSRISKLKILSKSISVWTIHSSESRCMYDRFVDSLVYFNFSWIFIVFLLFFRFVLFFFIRFQLFVLLWTTEHHHRNYKIPRKIFHFDFESIFTISGFQVWQLSECMCCALLFN